MEIKIIYSLDFNPNIQAEMEVIENLKKYGYDFTVIDWVKEMGFEYFHYPTAEQVKQLYDKKDQKLINLYQKIRDLSRTHDVLIVNQSHIYIPEFIESLQNIYKVFYSGDDPDASNYCSKPYVKCYDHIFSAAVNFDKNIKMCDQFLAWGAKKANWWPLGFREDGYSQSLSIENIYKKTRDIDLIFVGEITEKRRDFLICLKKHFPQMKIYGRGFQKFKWRFLINLFFILKTRTWCWFSYLPQNEMVKIYQRTKIGINMHWSYGPSNVRTYQLPANGVMEICDCLEGLGDVFKINSEVIGYNTEEEAIKLINYYLKNDDERKKIAAKGFERSVHEYKREITFSKALVQIQNHIKKLD